MWKEFTRVIKTDPGEVAETVWAELPEKVQRVAETESSTRKGIRTLLERQTAEMSAADDALGKQLYKLTVGEIQDDLIVRTL